MESLWITVQVNKNKSFIVGVVYRHSGANITSFSNIESSLRWITNKGKSVYVVGDFNDDLLKNNKMDSLIRRLGLSQLIKQPTRIEENSRTLLDLLITNDKNSVSEIQILPSLADHQEITCNIKF